MLSFLLFKSIAKGNSFLKVFKKELPPQWLGWPDSDRRVPESKSGALPLGDIPFSIALYYSTEKGRLSSGFGRSGRKNQATNIRQIQ